MLWVCGLPTLFVHFHTQGNLGLGLESGKIRVRTEKLGLEGKLRIRVGRGNLGLGLEGKLRVRVGRET